MPSDFALSWPPSCPHPRTAWTAVIENRVCLSLWGSNATHEILSSWHLRLKATYWLCSLGSWEVVWGHRASHMGAWVHPPSGLISSLGRSDASTLPFRIPQIFPNDDLGFYLELMSFWGNDFCGRKTFM